ncbi:hypothetical protein TRFO_11663 [Tritrichomonas foetus]|uniref:Uncharacterized protein n=1 Tax=Tritrichomonas foetus TaxID=1144522 RepID=A0A1J4J8V7_9EUKA|nr:hypothetical protein TRFO_11663 [Tritrichomonas foetus]|eukprot:OHS93660.1 hypothetical protein TRFO_11663 [Tritrichomonas foetus]
MKGNFDHLEILDRHIPLINDCLEAVNDAVTSNKLAPISNDHRWIELSKYIELRVQKIRNGGDPKDIPMPDVKVLANTLTPNFLPIIANLDYITSWIFQAASELKIFKTAGHNLNIRAELPLTLRVCNIFVTFTKVTAVLHFLFHRVNFIWHCYRISPQFEQWKSRMATSVDFVDRMFADIVVKPLDFVARFTSSLETHLEKLTSVLADTMSQLFSVYSIFNWGMLSVEGSENVDSDSMLTNSKLLILQNLHIFYSTVVFFGLVFPKFFKQNISYASFVISVYSECKMVRITNNFSIPIATFLSLATTPLPKDIMENALTDIDLKFPGSHQARVRNLTYLMSDYVTRCELSSDRIALNMEQILALFGFIFYELIVVYEGSREVPEILNMMGIAMDMYRIISKNEVDIQRTFLYTMTTVDRDYMAQILRKMTTIGSLFNQNYIKGSATIVSVLDKISLERFDNGEHYDFYPMIITHGRLLYYVYEKNIDVLPIHSYVEHLTNICRHASFVTSPFDILDTVFPVKRHYFMVMKIHQMVTYKSIKLAYAGSALRIFDFIIPKPELEALYSKCVKAIFDRSLEVFDQCLSVNSKNVQTIFQGEMDPTFNVKEYLPPSNQFKIVVYNAEAEIIKKVTDTLNLVTNLPNKLVFGRVNINVKTELRKLFLSWFDKNVLSALLPPSYVNGFVTMLQQVMNPFFHVLGIKFIPTLIKKTQKAAPLSGNGSLKSQFCLYMQRDNPPNVAEFIASYVSKIDQFVKFEYLHSRYEPLGRRFVAIPGKSQMNIEDYFGYEPIKSLVQIFGIRAVVRINYTLINYYVNLVAMLVKNYETLDDYISKWFDLYIKTKKIDYNKMREGLLKTSSQQLISIGLVKSLREILGYSTQDVINELMPGLTTIILAAKNRTQSVKEDMLSFLESVYPGFIDWFLLKRVDMLIRKEIDPKKFVFFLAILFTNPEWDNMRFSLERAEFSDNLLLAPVAIN